MKETGRKRCGIALFIPERGSSPTLTGIRLSIKRQSLSSTTPRYTTSKREVQNDDYQLCSHGGIQPTLFRYRSLQGPEPISLEAIHSSFYPSFVRSSRKEER